jgi:twitching motility protein PilT
MHEVIKEGEYYGMQSFDQHLLKHLQAGRVTFQEAMKVASSPHDFKLLVQADQRLRHLASTNAQPDSDAPAPPVVADIAPGAPAPTDEPVMAPPPPDAVPAPPAEPAAGASAPPPGF